MRPTSSGVTVTASSVAATPSCCGAHRVVRLVRAQRQEQGRQPVGERRHQAARATVRDDQVDVRQDLVLGEEPFHPHVAPAGRRGRRGRSPVRR